ncbi:glycosyltransferase family 2 protein [Pedobacter sp. MW01-1-1]|uniref:glycosyltransferase family 2 protein n=1 Tax=Pedobacter sp. MW01-1-1 TaxID=3383027 RepID=UPI003FEE1917
MESKINLISIALCTYNGERYLSEQLKSILSQDYPFLEIVIVDDASKDGTQNILKSFKERFPQIKLHFNESNLGFNSNFNKAMSLCSGDFISIADQDDIWLPNKISKMITNIGSDLLLYHDSEYIDKKGGKTGKSTSSHHRFVKGYCAENLLYFNCVSGHTVLLRRELLDITPPFDNNLYYDWILAYTAACTGRLNFIIDKLVLHRKHPESSTGKDKTDAKKKRIQDLTFFLNHPLTSISDKKIISSLLVCYKELNTKKFSFNLFCKLMINMRTLFFIRKKSLVARIKLIYRESSQ